MTHRSVARDCAVAMAGAALVVGAPCPAQTLPELDGLCRIETDEHGDGVIDTRTEYGADAAGSVTWERYDGDGDGVAEVETRYLRGTDGRVSTVEALWLATGRVFRRTHTQWSDTGLLVASRYDVDGDGEIERAERYEYDDLTRIVRIAFDEGNDGVDDRDARFDYDADGRLVEERYDGDLDGITDGSVVLTWSAGRRIREAIDRDQDGQIDAQILCMHIEETRTTFCEQDVDGDGTTEMATEWVLDAADRPIRLDERPGDTPSASVRMDELYEALARHPLDDAFSGLIGRGIVAGLHDMLTTRVYDAVGRLRSERVDLDRDGRFETVTTYSYDCL